MTELDNKRRIAKNTVYLYIRMLFRLAVTLYTSRMVLSILGNVDYGVYSVVGSIVAFMVFLQNAMNASTQRFLSVEIGRGDTESLHRVFNMCTTSFIGIAVIVLVLSESIGLWVLNTYLNIPAERMDAARIVYQCSIVVCCLTVIQSPYNAAILSHEKMEFYAYVTIADVLLKLGIVFLLIHSPIDKLVSYALLLVIVTGLIFLITRWYCRHKFERTCRYHFLWDKTLFNEILRFSGWTLCESTANLAVMQGRAILVNLFYGVTLNTPLGIANQVSAAVYNFVANFQSSFNPQLTKSYTQGNHLFLRGLINQTSKFSYYSMFIISFPLLLNMPFVLGKWLVDVPDYTASFCSITLLYFIFEALSGPLWTTAWATGTIKKYQLVISTIRLITLPVSYWMLHKGYAPEGILWAWVAFNAVCYIYRLLYLKKAIQLPLSSYLKEVILPCALISVLSLPIPLLVHRQWDGWLGFIASTFAAVLITALFVWLLGLKKTEKKHITEALRAKLRK